MADSASARGWTDSPVAFGDALDELKTDGCMLLVVQPASGDAGHLGCERMLGADAVGDRRRLFVHSDAVRANCRHDATGQSETSRTVVYDTTARAATVGRASDEGTDPATTVTGDLATLADAAAAEIEVLAPAAGFEPGQLRVCVDSFGDLLAAQDLAAVANCVDQLRDVVTANGGMGHLHVSRQAPANAVKGVLDQFDAVVEVADDDDPRQRWHLPDESLSTAWLEL